MKSARCIIEALSESLTRAALNAAMDDGPEAVKALCANAGTHVVTSEDGERLAVDGTWMVDLSAESVEDLGEWIDSQWSIDDALAEFGLNTTTSFSEDFWRNPGPLYHATQPENVESIEREGIGMRSDTRGLSNRSVGSAVYTTTDEDESAVAGLGSYGSAVFEIDTAAMKADGYMPEVSQEPDVEEAEAKRYLASELEARNYWPTHGDDTSPYTVVIHGDIPAKYLKRV